jgi:hypothetical protein
MAPFLPAALLYSSLAVFFESVSFLRKTWGVVLYFALVVCAIAAATLDSGFSALRCLDLTGAMYFVGYVRETLLANLGRPFSFAPMSEAAAPDGVSQLVFGPMALGWKDAVVFLVQTGVSLALVFFSSLLCPLADRARPPKTQAAPAPVEAGRPSLAGYRPAKADKLTGFSAGVFAELRLALADAGLFWRVLALAGILAEIFAPIGFARPLALLEMIWCMGLFSEMGVRERLHDTLKHLAVLPNGRLRQIVSSWISGAMIALAAVSPALFRLLAAGSFQGAFSCFCGAVFIPSIAIFLGEWTNTRRAFEIVFVIITYASLNDAPFSYIDTSGGYLGFARARVFLLAALVAGTLAVVKRARHDLGLSALTG